MRGRKPSAQLVLGPWGESVAKDLPLPDWTMDCAEPDAWGRRRAEIAQQRWQELTASMAAKQTLDQDNAVLIELAAGAYADWRLSEAHVAKYGPIVPAPRTGVPMHNPYKAIADAAGKRVLVYERELGISPIERGRVTPARKIAKKSSPADAYLKPANRA